MGCVKWTVPGTSGREALGEHAGSLGEAWLTLHLRLVHDEVTGGPAALKLLRAALLGTQLLVFSLVQGESRGGEATVAGGACQGCQGVLLGRERERMRKNSAKPLDTEQPESSCLHPSPQLRIPKLHE